MKIYNTMSREKEDFEPSNEKRIKLFVCGPTVYDDAHIGHARTYISFDIIKRYLEFKGFFVFYLQNITDIDDKIINRAAESNIDPEKLARKYEKLYREDQKIRLATERLGLNAIAPFIPQKRVEITGSNADEYVFQGRPWHWLF